MDQDLELTKLEDPNRSQTVACAHCGLETRSNDPGNWRFNRKESSKSGDPSAINLTATHGADAGSSNAELIFCCHGCMGAYALIHELGLDDFYSLRDRTASEVAPVRSARSSDMLTDLEAAGVPVEQFSDGLCRIRLAVDGLHCAACSWLIEKIPPTLPGLKSAQVRMSDRTLELIYDPKVVTPATVGTRLARLGYGLSPIDTTDETHRGDLSLRREHWIGMATAFFLAANSMWIGISLYAGESTGMAESHARFFRWTGALLGLMSTLGPGRIFFRSAWESLRAGVPHVDVPVALGLAVGTIGSLVGAAAGTGHVYFDSLASLVFLLRVGRYIQFRAQYRTGISISKLLRTNYTAAVRVQSDGTRQTVPGYRLSEGDLVEVLPGQIVPADGVVVDGSSMLQTAFITGESHPIHVALGTEVVGGSANLQAPLKLRVTAAGDKSRVGRLTELVRQATAQRTPLIQLADRIGGMFVVVVLGLAVATFAAWSWLADTASATEHTVALLTIACPCALALAAPLVVTIALGRAAREQIWIRDGNCLERLAKPGILWFDKTGTLTFGNLQVLEWRGRTELLQRAAALESHSNHPAARAITDYACSLDSNWTPTRHQVSDVRQEYGQGILGTVDGQTISIGTQSVGESLSTSLDENSRWSVCQSVAVHVDGVIQGEFLLGDRERPNAVTSLLELCDRGWKIGLLSGDRSSVVNLVGEHLRQSGIPLVACLGDRTPEDKLQQIRDSRRDYPTTVMVGDGINDAAALAAADVGIAVRGPGEVCLRNAPIYIPNNQLDAIGRLMDASRCTVAGIHRCFAASLLYNAITISLAVTGWIHPLIAALFMPLSGITVLTMALAARTFPARKKI